MKTPHEIALDAACDRYENEQYDKVCRRSMGDACMDYLATFLRQQEVMTNIANKIKKAPFVPYGDYHELSDAAIKSILEISHG